MSELILKNLTIGYDSPLVLNIDIEVNNSKLIVIIGENGSGKSTLMKTLLKLIEPISGEIYFNQKSIQNYAAVEWSEIFAAVFSRMGQIPSIKVKELIQIGAKKENLELRNNVIDWLEIESLLPKYANQISDGQLQKVMIARALLQDTPFVIFDEPTAHLDFKNKNKVFELLKDLMHKTGKTFIIISHEILQSIYLADEIWYIKEGQIYHGNPKDINQQFNLENEVLKFANYVRS